MCLCRNKICFYSCYREVNPVIEPEVRAMTRTVPTERRLVMQQSQTVLIQPGDIQNMTEVGARMWKTRGRKVI